MRRVLPRAAVVALVSATSCSTGATSATPDVPPANIAQAAKLQFAVGTATIAYVGGTFIGTNLVSTFRATNGHSATLANTPTITGPPNFAIGFPGSPNSVHGILPNVFNAAVLAASRMSGGAGFPQSFGATLGPLIGVFGYGMAADNLLSSQVALRYATLKSLGVVCDDLDTRGINTQGSPEVANQEGVPVPVTSEAQSQELGLPLGFGQGANSPNPSCPVSGLAAKPSTPIVGFGSNSPFPINYYGGPPAWPSAQGYGQPSFFVGYSLGFTDFAEKPVVGTYSLDVAYVTNQSATTYGHFDAGASLRNTNPLPALKITSATVHSDNTGSVVLTAPPGLFETIVLVRTIDCTNAALFDNYAIVTHSAGPQIFVFSANLGRPNSAGQPTQTFCNSPGGGPNATAYAVGFDYPAYESSYPFDISQTPKITNGDGHTGQADITTSVPIAFTAGS